MDKAHTTHDVGKQVQVFMDEYLAGLSRGQKCGYGAGNIAINHRNWNGIDSMGSN